MNDDTDPKPVSIAPAPIVNTELLGYLKRLVERVRTGEVTSAVICGEMTGREIFWLISGDYDVFRMLGALEATKARVLEGVE